MDTQQMRKSYITALGTQIKYRDTRTTVFTPTLCAPICNSGWPATNAAFAPGVVESEKPQAHANEGQGKRNRSASAKTYPTALAVKLP